MARITIKDIAQKAKVSIATVSRVINGNPTVAPEIYERVMAVVEETGYYPNQLARSLKISNSKTIGLLAPDITNEYIAQMVSVIGGVIRPKGYSLILCSAINDRDSEMNYLQLLLEKQVDGIIINTLGFNNAYIAEISHSIPIVALHRKIDHPDFRGDWIDTDIFACAYELTKLLLQKGHRKIASLNGPMRLSTGKMRYDGFLKAMREYGLHVSQEDPYYYEGDFTFQSGYDGAKYFMELKDPPTAIVNMHGEATLGMLRYFRNHNVDVPGDISLVSVSGIPKSDILYVRPYHYRMQPDTVAYRAATLLLERIESNNTLQNRECCFSMPIVPGNSVRGLP